MIDAGAGDYHALVYKLRDERDRLEDALTAVVNRLTELEDVGVDAWVADAESQVRAKMADVDAMRLLRRMPLLYSAAPAPAPAPAPERAPDGLLSTWVVALPKSPRPVTRARLIYIQDLALSGARLAARPFVADRASANVVDLSATGLMGSGAANTLLAACEQRQLIVKAERVRAPGSDRRRVSTYRLSST